MFHNASQQATYDLYARDTVQGVVDGVNGAIMSYGQTGSGRHADGHAGGGWGCTPAGPRRA